MIGRIALAALISFGSWSASGAPAAAEWRVDCDGAGPARACRLRAGSEQTVEVGGETRPAARIDIRREQGAWIGQAELPLGLYLPVGIRGVVDGSDESFALEPLTCAARGCLVGFTLGPETLARLRSGDALEIAYVDAATGRPMRLRFDLAGFSAAWREATR